MPPKQPQQSARPTTSSSPTQQTPTSTPKQGKSAAAPSKPGRKFDLFYVLGYFLFFSAQLAIFVSRCDKLLPAPVNDVCPTVKLLHVPFRAAIETYDHWRNNVFTAKEDHALLLTNRVTVLVLGPLALILAIGFITKGSYVKNLAIIHSAALLYSMVSYSLIAMDALANSKTKTIGVESSTLFYFVTGFFFLFPLSVLARVWSSSPFHHPSQAGKKKCSITCCFTGLLKFACFIWLLLLLLGVYEIAIDHTNVGKGYPSIRKSVDEYSPVVKDSAIKILGNGYKVTKDTLKQTGDMLLDLFHQAVGQKTEAKQAPPKKEEKKSKH